MEKKGFGYRRSLGDKRDRVLAAPAHFESPSFIDLEPDGPPVYDQANIGSCTGNGIAGQLEFRQIRLGLPRFAPSRLFIYQNELRIEKSLPNDAGAEPRHGIWICKDDGVPAESEWLYDITRFAERPPQSVYHDAVSHKIDSYEQLAMDGGSYHLRHALMQKMPPGEGFTVYSSFEDPQVQSSGIWPEPNYQSEEVIGGHYGVIVGSALNSALPRTLSNGAALLPHASGGWGKFRNSWGVNSGVTGHIWMPFSFLFDRDVSGDQWVM